MGTKGSAGSCGSSVESTSVAMSDDSACCSRRRSWAVVGLALAVRAKSARRNGRWYCLIGFGRLRVRRVSSRRCRQVCGWKMGARPAVENSNLHSGLRQWEFGVLAGCRGSCCAPWLDFQIGCEQSCGFAGIFFDCEQSCGFSGSLANCVLSFALSGDPVDYEQSCS